MLQRARLTPQSCILRHEPNETPALGNSNFAALLGRPLLIVLWQFRTDQRLFSVEICEDALDQRTNQQTQVVLSEVGAEPLSELSNKLKKRRLLRQFDRVGYFLHNRVEVGHDALPEPILFASRHLQSFEGLQERCFVLLFCVRQAIQQLLKQVVELSFRRRSRRKKHVEQVPTKDKCRHAHKFQK